MQAKTHKNSRDLDNEMTLKFNMFLEVVAVHVFVKFQRFLSYRVDREKVKK